MADNTVQSATDTIRTKDRAGIKTEIFGIDVGIGTGTEALMGPTNPMPVIDNDASTTGTISAADAVVGAPAGAGALLSGASTAGSLVALACPGGDSAWIIQVTGTFGGTTIYWEGSIDSTNGTDGNWINLNGRQTGVVNTVLSGNTTAAGFYRGNTSGLTYLRARAVGGAAITVAVKMRISSGEGAIFLNASIPGGTNAIGKVGLADTVTPANVAKVTAAGEQFITDSNRVIVSVGVAHTGKSTVTNGADAATGGRFWLINPVGSAVLIEVRRVEFSSAPTAATAFVTSPRVTCERFTFTGTASGATVTAAARDSTEAALVGSLRSASTGMTITAGAVAYAFTVVPILTAVGAAVPALQEWEPNEAGRIVLRAGQGLVMRQADGGTVSDTRAFAINLAWAEFTVLP